MTNPSAIPGSVPPAGWYADPVHPSRQRWWDGIRWSDQVRGIGGVTAPTDLPAPLDRPRPGAEFASPSARSMLGLPPVPLVAGAGPTTEDGVPLASFWRRAVATIFDNLLVAFAVGTVLPFFINDADSRLQNGMLDLYRSLLSGGAGTMSADMSHLLVILTYSVIGATMVYGLVTLGFWSRTLGQRVAGIAVAPTDKGKERIGWRHAVLRTMVWTLLSQGGGFLIFIHLMSISLALWHPRRQTFPDLLARTQVVRR